MALESRREKIIYYGVVPVVGAVLGAIAASIYAGMAADQSQLMELRAIIQDSSMTGAQKLQALEMYREMTDRPWSVVRSLVGILAVSVGLFAFDIGRRIRGN